MTCSFVAHQSTHFSPVSSTNSACIPLEYQGTSPRYSGRLPYSQKSMVDCRMIRLTFGIASSPYLASQVLRQLALDYKVTHPRVAEIIRTTFYGDDCLTGEDTLQEATTLRVELNSLLNKACMTLRKWRSNSTNLLQTITEELKEKSILDVSLSPTDQGKALGLRWDTGKDELAIFIPPIQAYLTTTKQAVCSLITRTVDVLGWYSPVLMPAKLLLQELWTLKLAWDDTLPNDIQSRWRNRTSELPLLAEHSVQRHMRSFTTKVVHRALHSFSDASSKAYGGVVCLRVILEDTILLTFLVIAKSQVAPIKTKTIPHLELCGAFLLTNLLYQVSLDLNIPLDSIYV